MNLNSFQFYFKSFTKIKNKLPRNKNYAKRNQWPTTVSSSSLIFFKYVFLSCLLAMTISEKNSPWIVLRRKGVVHKWRHSMFKLFFDSPPSSSYFLLLGLMYCRHKIIDPFLQPSTRPKWRHVYNFG